MNEVIERIPLEKIISHPGNRKIGGLDEKKLEQLAESIRAVGVQQPAIVRFMPDKQYQLVAGERRWRASKLAGIEFLPCVVRNLTDDQALKIMVIENLQREDVHPLDEADGYQRLRDEGGYDVNLIAMEVGRSPAYVYQRLRLQQLIPELQALLIEDKVRVAAVTPVARLDPAQQRLVYKAQFSPWQIQRGVVAHDVEDWIRHNLMLDLAKVAWKLTDATLIPKSGSCSECLKRTGADPVLFDDYLGDHCTDAACFKAKTKTVIEKNLKSIESGPYLVVKSDWGESPKKIENALNPASWRECKKKDEGAVRAIVINGSTPGRLTYAKKIERTQNSFEPSGENNEAYEARVAAEQARHKAIQITNQRIFDEIMKQFAVHPVDGVLRIMAMENVRSYRLARIAKAYAWNVEGDEEALEKAAIQAVETMEAKELVRFQLVCDIAGALEARQWDPPILDCLDPYLEHYGIDGEAIRDEIFAEQGASVEEEEEDFEEAYQDEDDDNQEEE